MAFSSSSYMRKRLPQPKARIETFALVRPSVRLGSEAIVGWASTTSGKSEMPTPAVVRPTRSRNFLRDKSFIMGTSPARENDCSAEPRKRRGSPRAGTGVPFLARAEFSEGLADPRGNARSARGRQRKGQLVIESNLLDGKAAGR